MPIKSLEITPAEYSSQHTSKKSQFYVGYSTVGNDSTNSKVYDFELIKRDILNQFNTRKGERVMNPQFGTIIWDILFEPFTSDVKSLISQDIKRICSEDPRAVPIQLDIDEQEYGMLLEVTLQYVGTDKTESMRLTFDKNIGLV